MTHSGKPVCEASNDYRLDSGQGARPSDQASIESRSKGPSNTKSTFLKAQKLELRIHGPADSRNVANAALIAVRVGGGARRAEMVVAVMELSFT